MKKFIVLSIASILASSGFAAAQMAGSGAPEPRTEGKRGQRGAMKARMLAEADTDQDGRLSKEERKAFRDRMRTAHFARKDDNGDGVLSQDELGRMPAEMFSKLDTDGSGSLTAAELEQGFRAHHARPGHQGHGRHGHDKGRHMHRGKRAEHMFEKLDVNKDGKVTKAEMRSAADKRFDRIDANGDGAITLDEAKAHHPHKGKGKGKGKRAERAQPQADDQVGKATPGKRAHAKRLARSQAKHANL